MRRLKKFVTLNKMATPERLGVSHNYFNAHIKSQKLEVQYQTPAFYGVVDDVGGEFSVPKSLVDDPSAIAQTVGQEMTHQRGVTS